MSEPSADISLEGWPEIGTTAALNLIVGIALIILFELKRNKRSVHGRRLDRVSYRTPPPPPSYPFGWLVPIYRLEGKQVLRLAGLDAYLLLRFEKLCFRTCIMGTFWGMLILAPIYYSKGNGSAEGFYLLTMANLPIGSEFLWVPVVFAYILTAHVCYLLSREYKTFAQLRQDFLCYGDLDLIPQSRYSIMVESLPPELRSGTALQAYFDALFPGEVFSAVVCQDVRFLESLVAYRGKIVRRLERIRAVRLQLEEAAMDEGQSPSNQKILPFCCLSYTYCGNIPELSGETEEEVRLWHQLELLNQQVAEEQNKILTNSEKLNNRDDKFLKMIKLRAKRGLVSIGQLLGAGRLTTHKRNEDIIEDENQDGDETVRETPRGLPFDNLYGEVHNVKDDNQEDKAETDEIEEAWVQWKMEAGLQELNSDMESTQTVKTWVLGIADDVWRSMKQVAGLAIPERSSSTGFVTFKTLSSKAAASQILITHRPANCIPYSAPEPRDIIWSNVTAPMHVVHLRTLVTNILLVLGALLWSVPLAFIQALTSIDQLEKVLPFLHNLPTGSVWYDLVSVYVPVLALLVLISLLPIFFKFIAKCYEMRKCKSEVQQSVMSRYFYYQLANIWITVASGSIFESFQAIIDEPAELLNILGKTFPSVAVYFVCFVTVKFLAGLPVELNRLWPLIRIMWSQRCGAGRLRAFLRCRRFQRRRTRGALMRGAFTPPEFDYGGVYPTLLLVLVVCLVYAVITPFMLPVGACFFAGAYVVHKYQVLYTYVPPYESGGSFWFEVHDWTLVGLVLGQLTILGYTILRGGISQTSFLVILPLLTLGYRQNSKNKYRAPALKLSIERARQLDENVFARHPEGGAPAAFNFDPLLYVPLALRVGPAAPENAQPSDIIVGVTELPKVEVIDEGNRIPLLARNGAESHGTFDADHY